MNKSLWAILPVLAIFSLAAHAEIYKWKDSNGHLRYSDVPPMSNVPYESLGGKKTVSPAPAATAAPAEPAAKKKAVADGAKDAGTADNNKDEIKEAALKIKRHNCIVAKESVKVYQQGGNVYKMNEKGEREQVDSAGIAKGLEQSQKDVEQYCSGE